MALTIDFAFSNDKTVSCIQNMADAIERLFVEYDELPEIVDDILLDVDNVILNKKGICEHQGNGDKFYPRKLSNTCKTLICLALDTDLKNKYKASYIGYGYHYWLTEINKIAHSFLMVDTLIHVEHPGFLRGADLTGAIFIKYNQPFHSIVGFTRQYTNEYMTYLYHVDKYLFDRDCCGKSLEDFDCWEGYF